MVVPAGGRDFSLLQELSGGSWCIPSFLLNGYRSSLPLVKWPQREVNCSLSPPAEIKIELSYTSTPFTHLNDLDRDNFTFHFFSALVCITLLNKSCILFRCRFAANYNMNRTVGVCVVYFANIKYWAFYVPSVTCVQLFFH
jgi:hypothetical protein